jgi:hypothetical protein
VGDERAQTLACTTISHRVRVLEAKDWLWVLTKGTPAASSGFLAAFDSPSFCVSAAGDVLIDGRGDRPAVPLVAQHAHFCEDLQECRRVDDCMCDEFGVIKGCLKREVG